MFGTTTISIAFGTHSFKYFIHKTERFSQYVAIFNQTLVLNRIT